MLRVFPRHSFRKMFWYFPYTNLCFIFLSAHFYCVFFLSLFTLHICSNDVFTRSTGIHGKDWVCNTAACLALRYTHPYRVVLHRLVMQSVWPFHSLLNFRDCLDNWLYRVVYFWSRSTSCGSVYVLSLLWRSYCFCPDACGSMPGVPDLSAWLSRPPRWCTNATNSCISV